MIGRRAAGRRTSRSGAGGRGRQVLATVRSRVAAVVWGLAALAALMLAVGALLIALGANTDNALVAVVIDIASALDLGIFSRNDGIFTFEGDDAETKNALVNWGLGAVAYLVVGKTAERAIAP